MVLRVPFRRLFPVTVALPAVLLLQMFVAGPSANAATTFKETTGGVTNTWTNYANAGGREGPQITSHGSVQVACRLTGFKVADGDTWWYQIASSPWNDTYYASADAFYNNGQTSGSLKAKVRDVVGLYLHPPENAVVVCIDEKSQCQALERSQPILPMRSGIPERQAHDYARHGVTCLFAALNAATGQVTDACYPRHRHQEFLRFLKKTAAAYPGTRLHVICDNYATHKHAEVKAWLKKNPRVTLHFTPTGCSWINLVECFFSVITRQAIRRGSFTSVRQLTDTIGAFIDTWNDHPRPFAWTKDADEILARIRRAKTKTNALTHH
jgi:transposase